MAYTSKKKATKVDRFGVQPGWIEIEEKELRVREFINNDDLWGDSPRFNKWLIAGALANAGVLVKICRKKRWDYSINPPKLLVKRSPAIEKKEYKKLFEVMHAIRPFYNLPIKELIRKAYGSP